MDNKHLKGKCRESFDVQKFPRKIKKFTYKLAQIVTKYERLISCKALLLLRCHQKDFANFATQIILNVKYLIIVKAVSTVLHSYPIGNCVNL